METTNTVLQKFWQRVFNQPDGHAMNIRNPNQEPIFIPVAMPYSAGGATYVPPPYVPMTYGQIGKAVASISAFLKKRGLQRGSQADSREGDRVAIIAWNSPEWVIFDLAVQSIGGVTVPIYPNNGPEQVNYVLENSDARWVFSDDAEQLAKASVPGCEKVLFNNIPRLLTLTPGSKRSFIEHFLYDQDEEHGAVMSLASQQLLEFQQAALDKPCCGIKPSDLATIIYTSGSTGVPKGVELTHDNFAAGCQSMVEAGFQLEPANDLYMSYLPLAHVYERAAGAALCIWSGIPMAFEANVKKIRDVLPVVQPTLFHGVPAVWRGAQDAILARSTGFKGKILNWALSLEQKSGFKHFIADLLVFRRIRNGLGGRIRIATSGGAPLSKETVEFFQKAGIEISQGYGLTETTGAVTVNRPSGCHSGQCNKAGTVGPVIDGDGTEIRIAEIPGQVGQGEIQIKGRKVMRGYWKLPEETKKVFTEDGWFRSGDLGHFDEDNFLVITGRLKRLLKTDGGKYVAPEKIEKAFEGNPIVQCNVTVGDGMPYMSGLIFINVPIALQMAAAAGITPPAGADVPTFLSQQKVILDAVQKAVDNANAKLERWEQYKKFTIIPVEATVEGGLLTPTQKIRTEEVLKRYKAEIDAFYQKR